jgi:hypothetical protein
MVLRSLFHQPRLHGATQVSPLFWGTFMKTFIEGLTGYAKSFCGDTLIASRLL